MAFSEDEENSSCDLSSVAGVFSSVLVLPADKFVNRSGAVVIASELFIVVEFGLLSVQPDKIRAAAMARGLNFLMFFMVIYLLSLM